MAKKLKQLRCQVVYNFKKKKKPKLQKNRFMQSAFDPTNNSQCFAMLNSKIKFENSYSKVMEWCVSASSAPPT